MTTQEPPRLYELAINFNHVPNDTGPYPQVSLRDVRTVSSIMSLINSYLLQYQTEIDRIGDSLLVAVENFHQDTEFKTDWANAALESLVKCADMLYQPEDYRGIRQASITAWSVTHLYSWQYNDPPVIRGERPPSSTYTGIDIWTRDLETAQQIRHDLEQTIGNIRIVEFCPIRRLK